MYQQSTPILLSIVAVAALLIFIIFGVIMLFKIHVILDWVNNETVWGRLFSTAKQREITFWRLLHIRMLGVGFIGMSLLMLLRMFNIIK